MRIAALILAAGRASRFGSDKRRAAGPWKGPMLHHVIGLYRPLFDQVAVVIGPDDPFGAEACRAMQAIALVNPLPERGMGTSLAVGMDWLIGDGEDGVVVGLGDMPWISPATIGTVRDTLRHERRAVAPSLRGEIGFPRGIPSNFFADLAGLEGEQGASAQLDWWQALLLPSTDPGILRDIDRPEDIRNEP